MKKIGTRVHFAAYISIQTPSAAEGKPDEQKIGAFGVGKPGRVILEHAEILMQANRLLQVNSASRLISRCVNPLCSLFSITEEPFVTSGNQWMGFYWKDKKDQLFA
jgi:hypothetical protein